jgi:hypothetical protein
VNTQQDDFLASLIAYDKQCAEPSVVDFLLAPHHGCDAQRPAVAIEKLQPRRMMVGHREH